MVFFVCYVNFPSYSYRALLVITWCYRARIYANQYMQISMLNLSAVFPGCPGEAFVACHIAQGLRNGYKRISYHKTVFISKQILVDRERK